MWTIITVVGVVAAIIIIAIRLVSSRPSAHDPQEQPAARDPKSTDLPEPGSRVTPRRPDGSPVPGSQADRNRHGKP